MFAKKIQNLRSGPQTPETAPHCRFLSMRLEEIITFFNLDSQLALGKTKTLV